MIDPSARLLLARLSRRDWAADFYLAGGAGLSYHLGHRPGRDLDLMSGTNRLAGPERRDLLADLLALDPAFRVETARDGYLFARAPGAATGPGPGLRLFWYPYPLIDPLAEDETTRFPVASLADLGLMKIAAVISRAARRDFVDLFHLLARLPLERLLERSGEKFGHVRDFPLQALKALADFSDAETDPPASLAASASWEEIRAFFEAEVRRLGRAHVGLTP